jgi:hypothetical protein
MVVKIRFGRGRVVTRRKGKNSRIALLTASLLTLVSICVASLGMWRLAQDVGLAADFIYPDGLLSHWQIWIGASVVVQYTCWRLTRYARAARPADLAASSGQELAASSGEENEAGPRVAANV